MRPTKGIATGGRKPAKAQLDATVKLVEALATDWDPEAYEDRYRERLLEVIERKRKGRKITVPQSSSDSREGPPPDIMEALKASLERARSGEGFDVSEDDGDGSGEDGLEDLSRDELYERAQQEKLPGRSSMSRKELIDALWTDAYATGRRRRNGRPSRSSRTTPSTAPRRRGGGRRSRP